ncbi:CDP-alcohol phosphatidyltransferase family protein [Marinomonas sp. M1K-6]|uniref:CDP-alcohol phosphatidyltransferase family protein n=1 Tax=Marinomonas profundi TaxID=2726122 RepID=A0A847QXG0_9GAMM|nr:CDP-alcohol phosphatidyltransferase family protein [Marinomonas profundi]NLQ18368.1 CDP-alcohol phosphatidyltransferase family protein [Marinomonas profundi]UDV04883.1 CDP-alcohol phosphatidyltransferase family protein [Marinomonas profundi]
MLDRFFIKRLKHPLRLTAKGIDKLGIKANWITLFGFALGMMVLPALYAENTSLALLLVIINRALDGLDGAVARVQGPTDLGGYLDITLDFIFYSAVIFGFALMNPTDNALAASFLIFAFMGTGSSFLAFAIMAEKRKIERLEYGRKSLYFLGGLAEGTETIAFLVLICLLPSYFAVMAYGFGVICWITTATRIYAGYRTLR